jgi:hypothetical protein
LLFPRGSQGTFTVNATEFMEVTPMLEKYSGAYIIAGCVGLIAALKIFKCVLRTSRGWRGSCRVWACV